MQTKPPPMQQTQQTQHELKCAHCQRPLAEMKGAYAITARCPRCQRTTRYYDQGRKDMAFKGRGVI